MKEGKTKERQRRHSRLRGGALPPRPPPPRGGPALPLLPLGVLHPHLPPCPLAYPLPSPPAYPLLPTPSFLPLPSYPLLPTPSQSRQGYNPASLDFPQEGSTTGAALSSLNSVSIAGGRGCFHPTTSDPSPQPFPLHRSSPTLDKEEIAGLALVAAAPPAGAGCDLSNPFAQEGTRGAAWPERSWQYLLARISSSLL